MQTTMTNQRHKLHLDTWIWYVFAICLLSSGCSRETALHALPPQTFLIPTGNVLVIEVDQGTLTVYGHEEPDVKIEAALSIPSSIVEPSNSSEEGVTRIKLSNAAASGARDRLEAGIPAGVPVYIIQGKGALSISGLEGELTVQTLSASILIEGFKGTLSAATRRGSIQISTSEGELHAVAEADEIQLTDLHGQISATNIIGGIMFSGLLSAGDALRFETDHGDVVANLSPGSSAGIQLTSAGGRIVCTLPGLSGMFDRCSGPLGDAAGTLTIRTVSGAIILNATP
jgi:hypothetical protein